MSCRSSMDSFNPTFLSFPGFFFRFMIPVYPVTNFDEASHANYCDCLQPYAVRQMKGICEVSLIGAKPMPTQSQQPDNLRASVIDRFSRIATTPNQERKFPLGPERAKKLGYDASEIDSLPPSLTESFCGVGNPFSLGEPEPGQIVLDLGCGAGIDALLAAKKVNPNGKVIGVDMTPEMIAKSRNNAAGARGVERDVPCGEDRVLAHKGCLGRSGDLQRSAQPLPKQAEGIGRGLPGLEIGRSASNG